MEGCGGGGTPLSSGAGAPTPTPPSPRRPHGRCKPQPKSSPAPQTAYPPGAPPPSPLDQKHCLREACRQGVAGPTHSALRPSAPEMPPAISRRVAAGRACALCCSASRAASTATRTSATHFSSPTGPSVTAFSSAEPRVQSRAGVGRGPSLTRLCPGPEHRLRSLLALDRVRDARSRARGSSTAHGESSKTRHPAGGSAMGTGATAGASRPRNHELRANLCRFQARIVFSNATALDHTHQTLPCNPDCLRAPGACSAIRVLP